MRSSAKLVRTTGKEKISKKVHAKSPHRSRLYDDQSSFLRLERAIGNRAMGQLIQAKLKIGAPNDKYEQEADRVAEQVMRLPESQVQRKVCSSCKDNDDEELIQTKSHATKITPLIQRQVENEEEEEPIQTKPLAGRITPLLQRQEAEPEEEEKEVLQAKEVTGHVSEVTPDLQSAINSMRGRGQPLPESTRAYFEPRFGYDFGHVWVHTDSQAVATARELDARAFTTGRDIAFGAGQYAPEMTAGKRLLAHELAHVIQQTGTSGGQAGRPFVN